MKIAAPAKINLALRVLGKRDDGFHELETLMYPVAGLADELVFSPSESYELICETPGVPTDESNLVTKAVRAFEKATGKTCRYRIELVKRVPHGAGLGGGSSDAASALLALNELEDAGLTIEELGGIAAQFGSDTTFFVYRAAAWCRGRGELVEPAEVALKGALLLYKPAFSISTPEVFRFWSDSKELEGFPYAPQVQSWRAMQNDLERPAFGKYLVLGDIKRWLLAQSGVSGAMMSGSGSTMFALLESVDAGEEIAAKMRAEFGRGDLCEVVALS